MESEFTVSDLLYVKDIVGCNQDYNKYCNKNEYKICRIYENNSGAIMVSKVVDKYGYSDNMSTKHCSLYVIECLFLFQCLICNKRVSKCKHGFICECNSNCVDADCIECILFEGRISNIIDDRRYFSNIEAYSKLQSIVVTDANESGKIYKHGVNPLYNCIYPRLSIFHRNIYKKMLHTICFDTFSLVNHKRCGINSPMKGLYYDVIHIIYVYVNNE